MDPEHLSDNELIEASRVRSGPEADRCLEALYERFYPKVARWCLRICRDREEAADLAQEVFVRVHSRLDSFRGESAFSTWLYTVMRSVAINRGISRKRRESGLVELEEPSSLADGGPGPVDEAERNQAIARMRAAMLADLEPLEAQVLYLHYVDGLTLPAITRLLKLDNKSGAKAFVVGGMRKLKRSLRQERK